MSFKVNSNLKIILHPYVFVLKEGVKIQNDLLDYSLLMLQVGRTETLHSPNTKKHKGNSLSSEVDFVSPPPLQAFIN